MVVVYGLLFIILQASWAPAALAQAEPGARQADRCAAEALTRDERERTDDLARATAAAARADEIRLRPPAFTLAASLPLLVASSLTAATKEDADGWVRALPGAAALSVATSAAFLIARGSRRSRLRHETSALRARAAYLAELAQSCATAPRETSESASTLELRALSNRVALDQVQTELSRHGRILPISMLALGATTTFGLTFGALGTWLSQESYYEDDQYLAPRQRRLVFSMIGGASAGVVLTVGGGIWTALTRRARRPLLTDLKRLRQEERMLSPVLMPVPTAHGANLVLAGRF